jgi:hypothetical protein
VFPFIFIDVFLEEKLRNHSWLWLFFYRIILIKIKYLWSQSNRYKTLCHPWRLTSHTLFSIIILFWLRCIVAFDHICWNSLTICLCDTRSFVLRCYVVYVVVFHERVKYLDLINIYFTCLFLLTLIWTVIDFNIDLFNRSFCINWKKGPKVINMLLFLLGIFLRILINVLVTYSKAIFFQMCYYFIHK